MNIEEKTIKLAEVAGFTDIMLPMGFHQQMSDEKSKECGGRWRFEIPKYFEDLNAVHELEKALGFHENTSKGRKLTLKYFHFIGQVCESSKNYATAAQRCEAIGKTLNLW